LAAETISALPVVSTLTGSELILLNQSGITSTASASLVAGLYTGVALTGNQTIAGIKTFSSPPVFSGASIQSATIPNGALVTTPLTSLSASGNLSTSGNTITLSNAPTFTGTVTASAFSGSGALLTAIPYAAITSVPAFLLTAPLGIATDIDFTTSGTGKVLSVTPSSGKPYSFTTPSSGGGSSTFASDTDVLFTSLASGNIPSYNGTKWVNITNTPATQWREGIGIPGSTVGTNVGDFYLDTTPASGSPLLLANDADVLITSPASGNILSYNGTKWTNTVPASSAGGSPVYNAAGTVQTVHIVEDSLTTAATGIATVTLTGAAGFTSSTTYRVWGHYVGGSANYIVMAQQISGTQFTLTMVNTTNGATPAFAAPVEFFAIGN
jgi:hypothetical protein